MTDWYKMFYNFALKKSNVVSTVQFKMFELGLKCLLSFLFSSVLVHSYILSSHDVFRSCYNL